MRTIKDKIEKLKIISGTIFGSGSIYSLNNQESFNNLVIDILEELERFNAELLKKENKKDEDEQKSLSEEYNATI